MTAHRKRGRLPAALPIFTLLAFVLDVPWAEAAPPRAAVASAHPAATRAGLEIMSAGGNAFDAAVAASAALAVVEPYSSGLGGGGFWLLHRASDGHETMIDGRERAPLAAHRDLFLGPDGKPVPGLSLNGPLAAAIPGEPAALGRLAGRYGRLGLAADLVPAIRLARDGFEVDRRYRRRAEGRLRQLRESPSAAAQFLADGEVPAKGARLRQPDLAATLATLARQGAAGFYSGEVAKRLVDGVRSAGGIWTLEDLAAYHAVERSPIVGTWRDWRVVSASPPSSGGVLLVEMLNMLDTLGPAVLEGPGRSHALIEVMRRAYRDRTLYLGDPEQVSMPIQRLVHPFYAAGLIRDFDPRHATASLPAGSNCGSPAEGVPTEGRNTTHLVVIDRDGNWVSATLSINTPFGSTLIPPGTGVLLNNEMDDFSTQPGVPNVYGLPGGEANAVAPGRRMLSSMTPTFLESDKAVAILGTPGGSRIPTMVLQAVLAAADGAPVSDWVSRPRIHHQYLPDRVEYEPDALTPQDQADLKKMGHCLVEVSPFGNMQAILWDRAGDRVDAASDPRGIGLAGLDRAD